VGQGDGILAAGKHQDRAFKLRRGFAQDEDRLGFQSVEVR
jgi:hypothetical protein